MVRVLATPVGAILWCVALWSCSPFDCLSSVARVRGSVLTTDRFARPALHTAVI